MSEANVLGSFSYTYDGVSGRVATVNYPNGQTSGYTYLDNAHDRRLETIHHRYPGGATLSRFDYTYDVVGNILTWRQQADAVAVQWIYGYDAASQLAWAVKKTTDPVPTVLATYTYRYDPAGNRTAEQIDDQLIGTTYDALNRLVSQQPAGALVVEGAVSEPSVVTVQAKTAVVDADGHFATTTPVGQGTTTLTVAATDPSGNSATRQYEVDSFGAGRSFTYDANGNLTSDGTRTFEWDARNQVVAINVGTHRSEFYYDGLQRRVRVVEKESGVTQSTSNVVWCDKQICEDRAADETSVIRRAFALGEQASGTSRYFAMDHLGSVTELTDGSGGALARYAFDPSGRRTLTAGIDSTTVGFTGHIVHVPSATIFTLYRAYDPGFARWISPDPLGFDAGPNFYTYVEQSHDCYRPIGPGPKYKVGDHRTDSATPRGRCEETCQEGKNSSRVVQQTWRIVRITMKRRDQGASKVC